MKKLLFAGLLMAVLFWGCDKEDTNDAAQLVGTWVNTQVDFQPVLTDASFVCVYRPDGVQLYARGFQLDDDNKTWTENERYTYTVEGKRIIINGTDILNHSFDMEFEILSLTQNVLVYSVKKFSIDNIEYPDSKVYTCKKATTDYSEAFTGVWYGHCTTPGTTDTKYHYWEYFANGSFNYYYQDDANQWIRKSDNEGGYFLYGNLMATNYSNDLIAGGTGKAYECWKLAISGATMTWTGLRVDNHTVTYEMEKVANPPAIGDYSSSDK